jgi:hypothetical protein
MTEQTRAGIIHVHETEVTEWHEIGWAYVGPSEKEDYCIIEWPHDRPAVAPFKDRSDVA